jgi:lipopolysaccharide/colanic/teichoic acid biosynthesis glycosyltransferase
LGIVTSLISWLSLIASVVAMNGVIEYRKDILDQDNELQKLVPFVKRFQLDDEKWFIFMKRVGWIHLAGLSPPVVNPLIFLIAWAIALTRV